MVLMIGIQKELPLEQVVSELFRDFKGDEIGGQHASRGFNFQVWHAVLEALKAYKSGEDYAVVLEWQQDVAVLNSSTTPTTVRFVQLKKHETATHWKLHHLIAPEKGDDPPAANDAATDASPSGDVQPPVDGKPAKNPRKTKPKAPKPSFLAKLYAHRRRFKELAQSRLEFASNAKYEIPDAAGATTMLSSIELTGLDGKVREDLEEKVRAQLGVPTDEPIDLSDFGLLVSECPIADPHKHVAGELAEMQIGSELKLSGAATMLAVLVIASYVHQRAGTTRFAKNLQELLERAITRSDVDKYLNAANDAQISTEEQVQDVINRLNFELAPFALVSKMKRELSRACVEITNRAGPTPMVAAHLKALYEKNAEYSQFPKVVDIFAAWYEDFQKLKLPNAYLYLREYLYCLMSMIIQNANPIQQLPSVSSGSQSEDEE
ncbi:dsDNA nuclease domain-containing protein [Ralstonia pseudosolanacearum]